MHFLEWKYVNFEGPVNIYPSIGSDNGLVQFRQHAIIWTNDGIVYWRIYKYVSLGLNELKYIIFCISILIWNCNL